MTCRAVQRAVLAVLIVGVAFPVAGAGAAPVLSAGTSAAWSVRGGSHDIELGRFTAPAGDVNGDGTPDVLFTSEDADASGTSRVAGAYVAFLRPGIGAPAPDLSDPAQGYRLFSSVVNSGISSIADAGDVNGDGTPDQAVGLSNVPGSGDGELRIVYGRRAGGSVSLDAMSPADGYRVVRSAAGFLGNAVGNAGDVNGDGVPDQLVTAPGGARGAAWVVFGRRPGPASPVDLATLTPDAGYRIDAPGDGGLLGPVDNAGDVNGDGIPDQLIGTSLRRTYVVFGRRDGSAGPIDLASLGGNGYAITAGAGSTLGAANDVANAGDVSGDGIPDQLVGNPADFDVAGQVSRAYVVFGKSGSTSPIDASHLSPAEGYVITAARPGTTGIYGGRHFGTWVRNGGDVNGDGVPDALLDDTGAQDLGLSNAGSAYVVFGRRNPVTAPIDLAALDASAGYVIAGPDPVGALGAPVNAGDVNGDGHPDQVVGALVGADLAGRGAAYLVHAPVLPSALGAPAVTGQAGPGQVLTCRPAARPANASLTERIAWLRDGAEIPGVAADTYTVAAADRLHAISCRVTVSSILGSVTAVSPSAAVPGPPPTRVLVSATVVRKLTAAERRAQRRCGTGLVLAVRIRSNAALPATIEARAGRRLIVRADVRLRSPGSRHLLCVGKLGRRRLRSTRAGDAAVLSIRVLRLGQPLAVARGRLVARSRLVSRAKPRGARGTRRSSAADPRPGRPVAASR